MIGSASERRTLSQSAAFQTRAQRTCPLRRSRAGGAWETAQRSVSDESGGLWRQMTCSSVLGRELG